MLGLLMAVAACSDGRLEGATPDEAFEIVRDVLCEANVRCAETPDYDEAACKKSLDDKKYYQDPISDEDLTQLDLCLDVVEEVDCGKLSVVQSEPECASVKQYLDLK